MLDGEKPAPHYQSAFDECIGDLSHFQKLSPQEPTTTEECALIKTGLRPLAGIRNNPVDPAVCLESLHSSHGCAR